MLPNEVKPYKRELARFETTWGAHTIVPGRGKNAGKFVAESRGWGGKRGYWHAFDSLEEARDYVARQVKPSDDPVDISIFG